MKNKQCNRKLFRKNKAVVDSALTAFEEKISFGFSEENFENLFYCMDVIKPHLSVREYSVLEEHWRNSYTDNCDLVALSQDVEYIRSLLKL